MLPGQLTEGHVRAADARGQKTLTHRRITYTIEELYGLGGFRRVKSKSPKSGRLDESSDKKSIRESGGEHDKQDQVEGSYSRQDLEPPDGEGTPA